MHGFFCRWIRCEGQKNTQSKLGEHTWLMNVMPFRCCIQALSLIHCSPTPTIHFPPGNSWSPSLPPFPPDIGWSHQATRGSDSTYAKYWWKPSARTSQWRRLARTQHLKFYESSAHFLTYFMRTFHLVVEKQTKNVIAVKTTLGGAEKILPKTHACLCNYVYLPLFGEKSKQNPLISPCSHEAAMHPGRGKGVRVFIEVLPHGRYFLTNIHRLRTNSVRVAHFKTWPFPCHPFISLW